MEFWTSVKVILRRWYVVVPCLILTVVIGAYLVHTAKPQYKATGSVLLSGSGHAARVVSTPSTVAGINPYANMDQSQLAFLVSQAASSSTVSEQMAAAGAAGSFSVVAVPNEPAMTVSTMAATPAAALASYKTLVTLLNAELDRRQLAVGAPTNTLVGIQNWTIPTEALPQNAAKVKALILVVVVGVLLTLALTFLVDALLTSRVPWSKSTSEDDAEDDPSASDEDAQDDGVDVEPPLTRPVAVLSHIDLDDADLLSINDDVPVAPRTRRTSRYEFALPTSAERHASRGATSEPSRHGDLPAWSPPEERPRAAGS